MRTVLSEETCHMSQIQEKVFGKAALIAINLLDKIYEKGL